MQKEKIKIEKLDWKQGLGKAPNLRDRVAKKWGRVEKGQVERGRETSPQEDSRDSKKKKSYKHDSRKTLVTTPVSLFQKETFIH